ncbi:hypothetical protein H106_03324 [Trichophyton rubrum CBS 735.88]|nr:hypothetical protein H106_03324 [Trichophyton rubrum CBS 735.88]
MFSLENEEGRQGRGPFRLVMYACKLIYSSDRRGNKNVFAIKGVKHLEQPGQTKNSRRMRCDAMRCNVRVMPAKQSTRQASHAAVMPQTWLSPTKDRLDSKGMTKKTDNSDQRATLSHSSWLIVVAVRRASSEVLRPGVMFSSLRSWKD